MRLSWELNPVSDSEIQGQRSSRDRLGMPNAGGPGSGPLDCEVFATAGGESATREVPNS